MWIQEDYPDNTAMAEGSGIFENCLSWAGGKSQKEHRMNKGFKIILIVIAVGVIAYLGVTVYANFINPSGGQSPGATTIKLPDVKEADYALTINSTNKTLLYKSSAYEHYGTAHILHGYFELVGKEYQYRNKDLVLDEKAFGKITITKRTTGN
jgi:hypothetical protein